MTFALLVFMLSGLCSCSSDSAGGFSLGVPELRGPSVVFVGEVEELNCSLPTYPKNETILLQLFKKGTRDKALGVYTSLNGEVAVFPMVVRLDYDGNLQCVARAQNNSNIQPTVSIDHYLRVIDQVTNPEIEIITGSAELFEGERLQLECSVERGSYVSYEWLVDGRPVSPSYLHQDHVHIRRISPQDSGSYMCVASNVVDQQHHVRVHATNSSEVVIAVKAVVSQPEIWFELLKDGPDNYSVKVTCQSSKGTPPITFSLHNSTQLLASVTTEDRYATFRVPLVLSQPSISLACQANNGDQSVYSERLTVKVVPVSGPVTMTFDYDIGENYAVIGTRLYCQAAKGSHPRYQWFLNQMLLRNQDSVYIVDQLPERSILLLSLGPDSGGTYHCQVSDSFDNTTAIRSNRMYIDREALNHVPLLVQVVVFGSFTFLVLLVSLCCWAGVLIRRRQGEVKLLSIQKTDGVDESVLELSEFSEGPETMWTVADDNLNQSAEDSEDEWPQIVKQKKTLEDFPHEQS